MLKRIFAATVAILCAGAMAFAITVTGQFTQTKDQVVQAAYFRMSTHGSLTALASGGQTGATLMDAGYNVVTTVAAGNDSVMLPSCKAGGAASVGGLGNTDGLMVWVTNAAASNSMNVYPQSGEQINALGANGAYAEAANKTVAFICSPAGGTWFSVLGG